MKTKNRLLLGLLFLLITGNISSQNWDRISKKIKEKQQSTLPLEKKSIINYFNLRKESSFLKCIRTNKIDTVFVLQIHREVDVNSLYSMAWNKNDTVSVNSEDSGKTYQIKNQQAFTNHMMNLVSRWNIKGIRNEEKGNGVLPSDLILATRIVFNGKKKKIACIYFKNFFNLERDGMDFVQTTNIPSI